MVHERIIGQAPDGRPYAASDPHLLQFVHCTEVDSFLSAHDRYGASPLPSRSADRYVAEMAIIAEQLGVRRAPRSREELHAVLDAYQDEYQVGTQARQAIHFLTWPPLPLAVRPAYALVFAAATSLLPPKVRWKLRLPLPPIVEPMLIRPSANALMRGLGWALGSHPITSDST